MIGSILGHAAVALLLVGLLAWAVAAWLAPWLGLIVAAAGATAVVALAVFARGALGPRGGG